MKKLSVLLVLLLVVMLSGCEEEIEPIDNPEIDLFQVLHVSLEYTIYVRSEIDETRAYYAIGYGIGDGYVLGEYHMHNYRVLYDGEYYNLQQGNQLGLYEGEDLIEYGVDGISYNCYEKDN